MNRPCPYCGRDDATCPVETALESRQFCGHCNSLFHGTTSEYASWELRRLAHRAELGLPET